MSNDFAQFGIESVENLVAIRRNRFIKRYGETDSYLCQMFRCLIRLSVCILLIVFVLFLLAKFIHLCCVRLPFTMVK